KNTYVPTSILLLRKQNDYDDILFIDARDKTTFNNDLIIHLFTERENNKLSKIVTKSEIADNDYNLSAALYFKEETEIPEIEQLIDNQKYLSSKLQDLHYDFIHTISRLSPKNE
ncbi:N-6 DNA methylase, partial [Escherichia coli]|nr:N-6 DNA methylase [Escherichia coli]